jgi:cellulose synthase/poly-beta-1,6-N-acetylglucosamine synthase-like glycosyltransferase
MNSSARSDRHLGEQMVTTRGDLDRPGHKEPGAPPDPVSVGVVIPAHNEQQALSRCLQALAAQDFRGAGEIVVVANGCTDRTAAVARESAGRLPPNWTLLVLELESAAKWSALNAADTSIEADIRVYLDADVILAPSTVTDLTKELAGDEPRLAQPRVVVAKPRRATPGVRSFTRVWSSLPYVRGQVLGVGCYAVNSPGRALWGPFPAMGSDDTFVRLRFDATQKTVLPRASMTIYFPSSLRELVRVRARWCRLAREVRRSEVSLSRSERRRWLTAIRYLAVRPKLWWDGLNFSAIWICAVGMSFIPSQSGSWARAETSEVRL